MKTDSEWMDDWNNLSIKYGSEEYKEATEGISECGEFRTFAPLPEKVDHRNIKMADYCEDTITKAKSAYYNTGDSIMSDNHYDKLESYLRILRPKSKIFKIVGSV